MTYFRKTNNERSEAIELIKFMDSTVQQNTWQIKSVGGESTLNTGKRRMFPDVFIYGDLARTKVLQGWEVKMPDVSINNSEFIADAQRKADVLGVNSCFIWNFSCGILYVKESDSWKKVCEWNDTNHIRTRQDVERFKSDWQRTIAYILCELNEFFLTGILRPSKIGEILADTIFTKIIDRNQSITTDFLRNQSKTNTIIKAEINLWWSHVKHEYRFDEVDCFSAYAKHILINWLNKITFAHLIKRNHNPALLVEQISIETSPLEALKIFNEITLRCDFHNIFVSFPYLELIPLSTWIDLTDYNSFLTENGLSQIPQTTLQNVLESTVSQFKRNIIGCFTTPPTLAKILVGATIRDLNKPTIDPCCGTGTIASEALKLKEASIGIDNALSSTYASDKFSLPLQIANIAMTRINAINSPNLLFNANVFELYESKEISIINPQNGVLKNYSLPKFGNIVSNLPFVAFDQEGREEADFITNIFDNVEEEIGLSISRRSDLYQAILFHLFSLLDENSTVGVITSNSWLGTIAGQEFFNALTYYYEIESVLASGSGKWFNNADVVTTMLILKRKNTPTAPSDNTSISFGLIWKPLDEFTDEDIDQVINSLLLKHSMSTNLLTFTTHKLSEINKFLSFNLVLNACFYDINWLLDLEEILCPISQYFNVFRGMKTGQDEIYYINNSDDIDNEYIGHIFKSAKTAKFLIAKPDTNSFVCNKTLSELEALGHTKTLEWINRFKDNLNKSIPNKNTFWMNLGENRLSGSQNIRLFTGMNPDQRIFYGLLEEPSQINQRAIGFDPLSSNINLELCHALLNSAIGIFYVEATGFPKGLGALDNRAENMKKIKMLNPSILTNDKIERILNAFQPLLAREILNTKEEYTRSDRLYFEQIVADSFGYSNILERIIKCILTMQEVRSSVRQ
ncbi:MAG: N-6 DNA methylase [Phascolarctobacterium sp.]|nr:N-6 DNA methylase [Phascolarctobacterium sp.]